MATVGNRPPPEFRGDPPRPRPLAVHIRAETALWGGQEETGGAVGLGVGSAPILNKLISYFKDKATAQKHISIDLRPILAPQVR